MKQYDGLLSEQETAALQLQSSCSVPERAALYAA